MKLTHSALHTIQTTNQALAYQFGYEIPYLPDFLLEPSVVGEKIDEKFNKIFLRFQDFVVGLHKFVNASYALRYIYDPQAGAVRIAILGSLTKVNSNSETLALRAAEDLGVLLETYNFPAQILDSRDEKHGLPFFLDSYQNQDLNIFEIRQYERLVEFSAVNNSAYAVYPFQGPQGTLQAPFELMSRLEMPIIINVIIQPTEVSSQELGALNRVAYLSQTLSEINAPTLSVTSIQTRRDPSADLVGRLYEAYIDSLANPFLTVAQVLSPDINQALMVAKSLASSAVMNQRGIEDSRRRSLPTDTALYVPKTPYEKQIAIASFREIQIRPWGDTLASEESKRFRYLMGAKGAATFFRFPISINSGISGIEVKQSPPEFHPGPKIAKPAPDEIQFGDFTFGGKAVMPVNNLVRHVFITGFTGSGKTNTLLFLLNQIWQDHHIPFLVIESAKKEYRALLNDPSYKDLLIFTLGDETTSPFRFNPFELMPGVRLEAHLGKLQACFDSALPQFGILPSIIAEALEKIYLQLGWKFTDKGEKDDPRSYPTMEDLYKMIIRVTEERGYKGETYYNIRAAAAGRIGALLGGSRGRMINTQKSISPSMIFNQPVIFELNDLNQDDKSLMMMFLLMWLREYREFHQTKHLGHVTVIEEAHNVLRETGAAVNPEISANTKGASVEAFTNIISEIRSYGEGLIIVDQSPAKISRDAIRNTNLQIAHQLRDEHDRSAIARSMIMDENQLRYLGKLDVGKAALFYTGIEKATFIRIPDITKILKIDSLSPTDDVVRKRMQPMQEEIKTKFLPYSGCKYCKHVCEYRETVMPFVRNRSYQQQLIEALSLFKDKPEKECWESHWSEIAGVCLRVSHEKRRGVEPGAGYCFLVQSIDFPFTAHMSESFDAAVDRLRTG